MRPILWEKIQELHGYWINYGGEFRKLSVSMFDNAIVVMG